MIPQAFTSAVIQIIHHKRHIFISDGLKRRPSLEKLVNQTIGILIGASLPGGIWMCKVNPGFECFCHGSC